MGLVVFLAMDFSVVVVCFFFVYGNGRTGEKLQMLRKEEEFINELRTARGGRVEEKFEGRGCMNSCLCNEDWQWKCAWFVCHRFPSLFLFLL